MVCYTGPSKKSSLIKQLGESTEYLARTICQSLSVLAIPMLIGLIRLFNQQRIAWSFFTKLSHFSHWILALNTVCLEEFLSKFGHFRSANPYKMCVFVYVLSVNMWRSRCDLSKGPYLFTTSVALAQLFPLTPFVLPLYTEMYVCDPLSHGAPFASC